MLSHLTNSINNLISILETGLVFFPNDREVFPNLTSNSLGKLAEPQCQGMISFTDIPFENSKEHRELFGKFGVYISKSWAVRNGACKVIYVADNGEVFNNFKSLFSLLKPEVKKTGREELDTFLTQLSVSKPEFAKSLGGEAYSHLLKLHEYMQTDEHVAEHEWRIIRPHKSSWSEGMDISEVKKYYLKSAKAGIIPSLKLTPNVVNALICPASHKKELTKKLPELWSKTEIWTY